MWSGLMYSPAFSEPPIAQTNVQLRLTGRNTLSDKRLMDTLIPAVEAAEKASREGASFAQLLTQANAAASRGRD